MLIQGFKRAQDNSRDDSDLSHGFNNRPDQSQLQRSGLDNYDLQLQNKIPEINLLTVGNSQNQAKQHQKTLSDGDTQQLSKQMYQKTSKADAVSTSGVQKQDNYKNKADVSFEGLNFANQNAGTQSDFTSTKQHLEIQQGQPLRSLRSLVGMTNKLTTNRYSRSLIGFLLFIFDTFVTIDMAYLGIHIYLTLVAQRYNDESLIIIYCVGAINLIGQGLLNFFNDYKQKQACESVNKLSCQKFVFTRKYKRFMKRPWEDLHVGDIIKINKNCQVPADCLILDIKNPIQQTDAVCYVRGGPYTLTDECELKRSCQNTQNKTGSRLSDSKFVQLLSGQIKWEYNSLGQYKGSLKLNENPAAFEFKNEHIVNRGSFVYISEQIICMVLNIGEETRGSILRERSIRTPNLLIRLFKFKKLNYYKYYYGEIVYSVRILQFIALGLTFLSWIMVLILHIFLKPSAMYNFEKFIVLDYPQVGAQELFLHIFNDINNLQSQYFLFFPYLIKLVIDCVIIFHNLFVLWDINLIPSNVTITNYQALDRLSQISHIVMSPSSILGHRQNAVMFKAGHNEYLNLNSKFIQATQLECQAQPQLMTRSQTRGLGPDGFQQVAQADNGSDDSSDNNLDETQNQLDYLPISYNPQFKFENAKVTEQLNKKQQDQDKAHLKDFLKNCVLCHSGDVKQSTNRFQLLNNSQTQGLSKNYFSTQKYDEAQLNFAKSFNYNFIGKKGQLLTIQIDGKNQQYQELVKITVELKQIKMMIQVIKNIGIEDGCTIVFKAPLQAIKKFIRQDYQQELDSDLQHLTKQGITALTFAKRELDSEYAEDLYRIISEVQSLHKGNKQKLTETLMSLCDNLELIGILGIKPYLNYRNSLFMEEVHRNGIKVWLLSSELEYETLLQINAAEFLQDCQQPLNVIGSNERQVEEQLKASLKAVAERINVNDKAKDQLLTSTSRQTHTQNPKLVSKRAAQKQPENLRNSIVGSNSGKKRESNESTKQKIQSNLEVVFTNGYSLSIIMKDESLLKIFLILCSLCNFVVGSSVSTTQKADLVKALKEFNLQANLGYVLSVIGNPTDMYMLNEADVNIGLIQKYRSADSIALTCLNVTELHSLTYILFKHASQLNRRQRSMLNFFFYRTILLMAILTYQQVIGGLVPSLPFQVIYTAIFVHILTPLQYFLFGISQKDFGYDIFHRIFGEYRNNHFANIFSSNRIWKTVFKALFDAFLLCFFNIAELAAPKTYTPVVAQNGQVIDEQTTMCYNSILLSLIQLKRMRDNDVNIKFFQMFYFLIFLLSLLFVLDDENLLGLKNLFLSPTVSLQLLFMILMLLLQETIYKVLRTMLPTHQKASSEFYKHVEEIIFMEEFEDSNQEFCISENSALNQKITKQIKTRDLGAVNQNMFRLYRSDSMDQILEKINLQSEQVQGAQENKIINRSTLINKFLRLNDHNKELEYQSQPIELKKLNPLVYTIYAFILVLICQIIMEVQVKNRDQDTKIAINVILAVMIVISAGLVIVLKKVKLVNYHRILQLYIAALHVLANVEKSYKMNQSDTELVYYAVITVSFLLRLRSYFMICVICIISIIFYCQLSYSSVFSLKEEQNLEYWEQVEQYYQLLNILMFLLIWILYAYWDEATRKIGFVTNFRKQKEFQKSKQILNILVPSIVRSRIQDGQKNFSEAQGMVTIVFCDIEGFDELVQQYEGKELIELLDQTYNAFDQLCEQYGLQKIETVGKTYMACGGLRIVESQIDQRLLGNHFTVRVMDYAFEMLGVANSIKLKTGQKLKVKIGIHSGEVVAGVVGETKPQFSLIGDTVNKTSRVCSKCPAKSILISKETHKQLEMYSNNFQFDGMEVFMKGIGDEIVYKVFKRKAVRQQISLLRRPINQHGPLNRKLSRRASKIQLSKVNTSLKPIKQEIKQVDYQEVIKTERSYNDLGERYSDQGSQTDNGDDINEQYGNVKEDRSIVKDQTLNVKYKLVERPRFLLQFNQKEQEQEFQQFLLKYYFYETMWFLIIKACLDTVLFFTVGWRSNKNILFIQLSWIIPYIILTIFLIRLIAVSIINRPNVVVCSIIVIVMYFLFAFAINTSQSIFDSLKLGVYNTCKLQLLTYVVLVYTLRAYQMRSAFITLTMFVISFGVHVLMNQQESATIYGFVDIASFICFNALLIINSYFREMQQRKWYNNDRIIDIEIENTEDLLSKLVPFHVLAGIKNDQRVVDVLENVTLLYTDMVGFTQFSNNVKNPVEVVKLLSKLFSKFDQLTEAHEVYKVHTIGDCYVIMGYTGKTPKFRRTTAVQIEEAYRVVKVGLEMIEIIKEVRDSSTDPNLSSLDMRIGIHTGKIVGGIIGTKVVRYDIFGQDVLIANKMESNGKQGCVCISDATLALLEQNQFIGETLRFQEHNSFEIGHIGKQIQSYLVEKIIVDYTESSSEVFSDEFTSEDSSEEESSAETQNNAGFIDQDQLPDSNSESSVSGEDFSSESD